MYNHEPSSDIQKNRITNQKTHETRKGKKSQKPSSVMKKGVASKFPGRGQVVKKERMASEE